MKRVSLLILALALSAGLSAREDEHRQERPSGGGQAPAQHEEHQAPAPAAPAPQSAPKQATKRERPARQPRTQGSPQSSRPAHIVLGRSKEPRAPRQAPQTVHQAGPATPAQPRSNPAPQRQAGNVYHRSTYVKGYAPERLKTLGIKELPKPIHERTHILDTDRAHSVISFPHKDGQGRALAQHSFTAKQWNDPFIRDHMKLVNDRARLDLIVRVEQDELDAKRYYWHHEDGGFDYCHYRDAWGYHWYGWYAGDRYFWTRHYANRWWFYDDAFNRWCFWNNGFWWWQDPSHVGDLYAYSDGVYIAGNSPDDKQVVSTVEPANAAVFRSKDDTRMVKIMSDSKDAFLYDTAIPPDFSPLYLASKVVNVQFSDTSKGQPLEITLTLSDGSMEAFDSQGASLDFGGEAQPTDDGEPDNGPVPNGGYLVPPPR